MPMADSWNRYNGPIPSWAVKKADWCRVFVQALTVYDFQGIIINNWTALCGPTSPMTAGT